MDPDEIIDNLLKDIDETKSKAADTETKLKENSDNFAKISSHVMSNVKELQEKDVLREKQAEKIADDMAKTESLLQEYTEQHKQITGNIETLAEKLDDLMRKKGSVAGSGDDADLRKNAEIFYAKKHARAYAEDDRAPAFDASKLSDEDIEQYSNYSKAMSSLLRSKHDYAIAINTLPPEQQKAVTALTNANEMFLPSEISDRVIRCWRDETDITSFYDNVTMSGSELIIPAEPIEGGDAVWASDDSCDAGDESLENWGMLSMKPNELRSDACLSGNMIADSAVDIEGRIAERVGRSFRRAAMRSTINGDGRNKPEGSLAFENNHVTVNAGNEGTGTQIDGITRYDLRTTAALFPEQFSQGAMWFGDTRTLAFILQHQLRDGQWDNSMSARDAQNRLIIEGYPYQKVDQMPDMQDQNGGFISGAKPLALTNPREHYLLARRSDIVALRDPYSKSKCRFIVWRFTARMDGKVKCANAFYALKIR